jgi:hypothetical protein
MKTSPSINYQDCAMKREYLDAVRNEPCGWLSDAPCDFGAIDAPISMPAGSTYSYYFGPRIGGFTDMPTSTRRGA